MLPPVKIRTKGPNGSPINIFKIFNVKGMFHPTNITMTVCGLFALGLSTGLTVYFTATKPDVALDKYLCRNYRHNRVDFSKPAKLYNHNTAKYQPPPQWLAELRKEIGSAPEV